MDRQSDAGPQNEIRGEGAPQYVPDRDDPERRRGGRPAGADHDRDQYQQGVTAEKGGKDPAEIGPDLPAQNGHPDGDEVLRR